MKKLTFLFLSAMALLQPARAQFAPSSIPEMVAGSSSDNMYKVTCDSRLYNSTLYGVTGPFNAVAWDGPGQAIRYFCPDLMVGGTMTMSGAFAYPDIVFSANAANQNLHLLLAYISGSTFVFTRYKWDDASSTFSVLATSTWPITSGAVVPSINLDADKDGNYALALGHGNGVIEVYRNTNATLPAAPVLRGTLAAGTGAQVDVCLNYAGAGPTRINVSYTSMTGTSVSARGIPFGTGSWGAVVAVAPVLSGVTYKAPRIACPINNGSCGDDVYSIVYQRIVSGVSHVRQFNKTTSSATYPLSEGGLGFPSPALPGSNEPVICYSQEGTTGCTASGLSAWNTADALHPAVGVRLMSTGAFWGTGTPLITYYDLRNLTMYTTIKHIALSGKYAGDKRILQAYFSLPSNRIVYKRYVYDGYTMRQAAPGHGADKTAKSFRIYPNPSAGQINIGYTGLSEESRTTAIVTDLNGRTLWHYDDVLQSLPEQLNEWFGKAMPGMYLVRISEASGFSESIKLVKQ